MKAIDQRKSVGDEPVEVTRSWFETMRPTSTLTAHRSRGHELAEWVGGSFSSMPTRTRKSRTMSSTATEPDRFTVTIGNALFTRIESAVDNRRMTVIPFPGTFEGEEAPRALYVCAPRQEQLHVAKRKFGLGHSRKEADARFFEGGANMGMKTRIFKVDTAPNWVKHQLVSQLMLFRSSGQPLSSLDEEALGVLGTDAYEHGDGPMPRRSSRSRARRR
jgi:hypothetical protein